MNVVGENKEDEEKSAEATKASVRLWPPYPYDKQLRRRRHRRRRRWNDVWPSNERRLEQGHGTPSGRNNEWCGIVAVSRSPFTHFGRPFRVTRRRRDDGGTATTTCTIITTIAYYRCCCPKSLPLVFLGRVHKIARNLFRRTVTVSGGKIMN